MARAAVLALALATSLAGARYADYAGGKMPEYAGGIDYEGPRDTQAPLDDYREHLQDPPAPLDYKYEEESGKTEKSLLKEIEEAEEWQKPIKKYRKPLRSLDNGNLDNLDKYSSDEVAQKFKPNYRFSKHRPRLKLRTSGIDETTRKLLLKYNRHRKDDISDIESKEDFQINADDVNDDKNVDFDDDDLNFNNRLNNRQTTTRAARRKVRERHTKSPFDAEPLEEEAEEDMLRKRISHEEFSVDDEVKQRHAQRRPPAFAGGEGEADARFRAHKKPKEYEHYSDYYDMKRVQGIKEKLPVLLRRPTTIMFPTLSHRRMNEEPRRRFMAPIPRDFATESETKVSASPSTTTSVAATTTTTTTTVATTTLLMEKLEVRTMPTMPTESPFAMTIGKLPQPIQASPPDLPAPPPETAAEPAPLAPIIPSFEERSRLSILKKAQRKEMMKEEAATKKPPVLLQVTNKMHTLVVVEPPTSQMPWQRAREVHDETPERLEKVKRLMRHKLVANAKSIHDLTENWDDMVCDYVDTSLLQGSGPVAPGWGQSSGHAINVNVFMMPTTLVIYFCFLILT